MFLFCTELTQLLNMPFGAALLRSTQDPSWTPLHLAAGTGDVDAVRRCLAEGHPVDPQITKGLTPLHIAAQVSPYRYTLYLHSLLTLHLYLLTRSLLTSLCQAPISKVRAVLSA